ncbi:MAG: efflux RND transporter periplasmic adaptor subunit, partial [Thermaurantiacus sp.]
MNMHFPSQDGRLSADSLTGPDIRLDPAERRARRRRTALIVAISLAALLAFVALLVFMARAPKAAAPPAGPPAVSVIVPGTIAVSDRVSATGTIAARRDMPVGVVGEGGMIVTIRAEAGQSVGRGQVLAEIDSGVQRAQLAQLEAAVRQAEADARLAQAELDRALALVERGFISRADIDRRTATRDSARARVAVTQAQVREMRERIARLAIRAPEAGLVLARSVEPGQVVSPGSGGLFRIAAGSQLEVRAQIAEQDMANLRVGQEASVTPVGGRERYAGTVWLLEPVIDPQTRLGVARVAVPAREGLRVGGFATVEMEGAQAMRPVLPQSAVLSDADGTHVFVIGEGDIVERRAVRVGQVSEA